MPPMPPMSPAAQPSSAPMVLGIIALVASLLFFPIGLILGIVAVVMAGKQIKQFGPVVAQKARTGKICGVVAIVISAIALVITIFAGVMFGVVLDAALNEGYGSGSGSSPVVVDPSDSGSMDERSAETAAEAAFDSDIEALLSGKNTALIDVVQEMIDEIDADAGPDDLSFALMGIDAKQIVDAMGATLSYTVTDLDYIESENKVWVTANITVVSLNAQIDEFDRLYYADIRQFESAQEAGAAMGELYLQAFESGTPATVEVLVEYYYTDGEWKILDSDWTYLSEHIAYASTGE